MISTFPLSPVGGIFGGPLHWCARARLSGISDSVQDRAPGFFEDPEALGPGREGHLVPGLGGRGHAIGGLYPENPAVQAGQFVQMKGKSRHLSCLPAGPPARASCAPISVLWIRIPCGAAI